MIRALLSLGWLSGPKGSGIIMQGQTTSGEHPHYAENATPQRIRKALAKTLQAYDDGRGIHGWYTIKPARQYSHCYSSFAEDSNNLRKT